MREEKQSAQGEARGACGWYSMLWCSHSVRRILFYGWHVYTAGILIGNIEGRTVQGAQKCPWCPCLPRKTNTLLTSFGSTLSFARPGRNNKRIWHFRLEAKCWYSKHLDHSCTRVVSTRKNTALPLKPREHAYTASVSVHHCNQDFLSVHGGARKNHPAPLCQWRSPKKRTDARPESVRVNFYERFVSFVFIFSFSTSCPGVQEVATASVKDSKVQEDVKDAKSCDNSWLMNSTLFAIATTSLSKTVARGHGSFHFWWRRRCHWW